MEHEDGTPTEFDDKTCQVKGKIPPFNEYLNVNTPLQVHFCLKPFLLPSKKDLYSGRLANTQVVTLVKKFSVKSA